MKIFQRTAAFIISAVMLAFCAVDCFALDVSAESAILIEAGSGRVIWEKDADKQLPIASTTKIMTALIAIENSPEDSMVTVAGEACGIEGSSIYLFKGERLTMLDLLYAVLLESANDAAAAVAIETAGSVENFAAMMNEKARELGLDGTHYTNPHGLDDPDHYSTARDLATLSAYALENPLFREITSTYKRIIPLNGSDGARLLLNHNRLLRQYDGAIGVKTGYTKKSGRCLVSAAERDGVRLICVTLNDPDDWRDHTELLDYGFSLYERVLLTPAGDNSFVIPVVNGTQSSVRCSNKDELYAVLEKGGREIDCRVELKRFYYAPISEGDILGRVVYSLDGEDIGSVDITADESVDSVVYENPIAGFFKRVFGR